MTLPLSTQQRTDLGLQVLALPALLTAVDHAELRELSSLARRVRAATPPLGRTRRASERLNALLIHHRLRGVTPQHLATATGLTERAVRTRLPPAQELEPLTPFTSPPSSDPQLLPEFLIIWPGTSSTRRWWTYADARTHLPARLVYSSPLLAQAYPLPAPYARVSPQQAQQDLGWIHTDPTARLIPDPTPHDNGGEPAPAPSYTEELSA